jgi:hypothetical protein
MRAASIVSAPARFCASGYSCCPSVPARLGLAPFAPRKKGPGAPPGAPVFRSAPLARRAPPDGGSGSLQPFGLRAAILGAGTMLPGTRTLIIRPPLGCRDASGTGLAGRLGRMRERVFPARFSPRPAHEGQRVFHARGRLPGASRSCACEAQQRAPALPRFSNASRSALRWAG